MTQIHKDIFRAYDIRGVVETELTLDTAFLIGKAIGSEVQQIGEKNLVIGRDGRLSGPALFQALSQGVRDSGCGVVDVGRVPTPLVYFATHHLNIPSGFVITGSHNPAEYNGIKIVINHQALYGEGIQKLYHRIIENNLMKGIMGEFKSLDIKEDYIQQIKNSVHLKRPLKIIVDAGNGVAGDLVPKLYEALGCNVIPLFCEIDGRFPNHHPDPGQPKNLMDLQKSVLEHKADLGLAFDGDGDRLGVVDNQGQIIWPDRQLILFARDILERNKNAQILYDVKCSRHVSKEIEKAGGEPLMWKTGHSLIKAKMKETGALLGGEMSGHFFFKERWFGFDDALYAGSRLLELFSRENTSSAEWFAKLPDSKNTPELQIKISDQEKFQFVEKLIEITRFDDALISTIDGLRVDFPDGFGLVRPSNTSPSLVLRFEGDNESALQRIQNQFRSLLLSIEPQCSLPF